MPTCNARTGPRDPEPPESEQSHEGDESHGIDAGDQAARTEVAIRTHKGSGERKITRALLKQVGHMPQQGAADQLNVGNTRFKTAMRELGMSSWPYRKIKSIRNLVNVVQTNPEQFHGQADQFLANLRELEDMVFDNPTMKLESNFKKFRQAAYKLKHKYRRRAAAKSRSTTQQ